MNSKRIVEASLKVTLFLVLFLLVSFTWQILETILTGQISPSFVDTIIALLFSLSLYKNVTGRVGLVWEDSEPPKRRNNVIDISEHQDRPKQYKKGS